MGEDSAGLNPGSAPELPAARAEEGIGHRAQAQDHHRHPAASLRRIHSTCATPDRTTEFIPFLDY